MGVLITRTPFLVYIMARSFWNLSYQGCFVGLCRNLIQKHLASYSVFGIQNQGVLEI